MPCSTMRNAHFLFFFLGFGGLGDVQLVTLYSLTCFLFLFNDLLIYLEILFLSYLLSLSMFYVIAFVWYSSTACSVFLFFQLVLLFPLGWFCGSLLLFVVEVVAFSPHDLRGVVACMYLGVGCLYVGCRDVCGHFFWRSNDFLVDPVVGNSIVDDLRRALH